MPFKSNQAHILKLSKLVGAHSRFRNNSNHPHSQPGKHYQPPTQDPSPAALRGSDSRIKSLGGLRKSVAGLFKNTGSKNSKPKESAPITPHLPLVIDVSLDLAQGDPSGSAESLVDLDTVASSEDVLLELIELYTDCGEEPNLVSHDSSNLTDVLGQFPHAPITVPSIPTPTLGLVCSANVAGNGFETSLDSLESPHHIDGQAPMEYDSRQHLRRHGRKEQLKRVLATVKVPKLRLRWPGRNSRAGHGANKAASLRSTDGVFDGGRQQWFTRIWHNPRTGRRLDAYTYESSHTSSDQHSLDDLSITSIDGIYDSLDTTSPPRISIRCPIPTVILTCDEDGTDSTTSSPTLDIDPDYLSPFYVRTPSGTCAGLWRGSGRAQSLQNQVPCSQSGSGRLQGFCWGPGPGIRVVKAPGDGRGKRGA
ncbi:hypothetical protein RhiJN_23536 [Ceratobasidium sp. AG-Ba]|nr:hypothetical protein RhiJN_23536 [Ceratobasidium sp. AG-Ba]